LRNDDDLTQDGIEESLDQIEQLNTAIVPLSTIGAITKSEAEAQIDASHQHPRQVRKFIKEAASLATMTRPIAMSCMYSLPRKEKGGKIKQITGPSVRLAEICASTYGNLHVGCRVIGIEDKEIIAHGVAWDLQRNLRATIEVRRRITTSEGRRYSDDMITMTGNAAASIALRNAIFRVIPRSYIDIVYNKAKSVAVGDALTLVENRQLALDRLVKMGANPEFVLARLGVASIQDVDLEMLETLVGWGTALEGGDTKVDELFPDPQKDKASVDLSKVRKSEEVNRGHGNENLGSVAGNGEKKIQDPPPTREPRHLGIVVSAADWEVLNSACKVHGVTEKQMKDYIIGPLGYNQASRLKNDDFDGLLAWIQTGGKAADHGNKK
jgi:hypothetical protein